MARGRNVQDLDTLQMALVGYQIEKQKIDDKIRAIEAQLRGKSGTLPAAAAGRAPGTKRVLSAAARRRIAAAQRKRWAAHRKRMAQASK
jgi:hypothetical protein